MYTTADVTSEFGQKDQFTTCSYKNSSTQSCQYPASINFILLLQETYLHKVETIKKRKKLDRGADAKENANYCVNKVVADGEKNDMRLTKNNIVDTEEMCKNLQHLRFEFHRQKFAI